MSSEKNSKPLRIPSWLRTKLPADRSFAETRALLKGLSLHTVCQSAKCPNTAECFSRKVATFLIMGPECTRNCAFCNITPGRPADLDPTEPARLAEAAEQLGLRHVVITSVTRDDLPDGGAAHFVACVNAVRDTLPEASQELLIPDFRGDEDALRTVLDAAPEVLNHNVETVPALYPDVRPQADYRQSLELLRRAKEMGFSGLTKSGLMLGLGETDEAVIDVLQDLADVGCDIVTIGQYMRPSRLHPEVKRYADPKVFDMLREKGQALGIPDVFSAPLVRSSYNAAKFV